jgi:hypothetical protein
VEGASAIAETRTPQQVERQALRRQLRAAGWNIGATTKHGDVKRMVLWPVPHSGPAEGVEPRWVEGADKTDVLRKAVRELSEPPPSPSDAPMSARPARRKGGRRSTGS